MNKNNRTTGRWLTGVCRGAAEVMLQSEVSTGVLFIAAILAGSLGLGGDGKMVVFVNAIGALMLVTPSGPTRLLAPETGLRGFNAVLVGCAAYVLFGRGLPEWLVIVAVFMTLPLKIWLDRIMMRVASTSSLTLPFILSTWMLVWAAGAMDVAPCVAESIVEEPAFTPVNVAIALLKGVSQVFLIDSWVAGVLFLAGLMCAGWRVAAWAVAGSAIGMSAAMAAGVAWSEVAAGLWGYSPVLTAVALATTLRPASAPGGWTVVVVMAAVATVLVQWMLTPLLAAAGLPVLTLPFCVVTWLELAAWQMVKGRDGGGQSDMAAM